jgi:hypothetical protein
MQALRREMEREDKYRLEDLSENCRKIWKDILNGKDIMVD